MCIRDSSRISLEKLGPFIPYGIIAEGVADFIKTSIRGGKYQLKEGSIQGRISQIAHLGENENCKVLHVKVGVDEGILSYGKNVPVISGIRGDLELLGRDMLLRHMTGKFGESPMTLEGRITDYCMSGPSGYPFTLTMNPGQKEVEWLLGIDAGSNFVFTGKTFLRMTGSGTADLYNLDGDWDLTEATYHYKDVFTKPPSQKNTVAFKSSFTSGEWQIGVSSFPRQFRPSGQIAIRQTSGSAQQPRNQHTKCTRWSGARRRWRNHRHRDLHQAEAARRPERLRRPHPRHPRPGR